MANNKEEEPLEDPEHLPAIPLYFDNQWVVWISFYLCLAIQFGQFYIIKVLMTDDVNVQVRDVIYSFSIN